MGRMFHDHARGVWARKSGRVVMLVSPRIIFLDARCAIAIRDYAHHGVESTGTDVHERHHISFFKKYERDIIYIIPF